MGDEVECVVKPICFNQYFFRGSPGNLHPARAALHSLNGVQLQLLSELEI